MKEKIILSILTLAILILVGYLYVIYNRPIGPPVVNEFPPEKKSVSSYEDLQYCVADTDCVTVSPHCYSCDSAINVKYLEQWNKEIEKQKCNNDISWPLCRGPYEAKPVCTNNRCELQYP